MITHPLLFIPPMRAGNSTVSCLLIKEEERCGICSGKSLSVTGGADFFLCDRDCIFGGLWLRLLGSASVCSKGIKSTNGTTGGPGGFWMSGE